MHNKDVVADVDILDWVTNFIQDYRAAINLENVNSVHQCMVPEWKAPPNGTYKINTDAAVDSQVSNGEQPLKFLIYGRTGWIGGLIGKLCQAQGIEFVYGSGRLEIKPI
ncbi:hypothetical protein LWI28_028434 [Acer negundo]|uniref:Uncharacterized protein n=1 Tax=Acer negundo TaxID=4023 RepID=A0AAD5P416_ACENE|nr:hypothetical protein LWI28_028434 [Acer negundo]